MVKSKDSAGHGKHNQDVSAYSCQDRCSAGSLTDSRACGGIDEQFPVPLTFCCRCLRDESVAQALGEFCRMGCGHSQLTT